MKVKVNLSNQTLEYMDSQPYIQGTDTRNKLSVYIEHSSVPQTEGAFNIMIAYALQNGRTTIKMANTGATQETIDDVLYDIFYFTAPKVLTSISGNFIATIILKVNTNTYKVNVLNTVLNAVDFEAFEDALDDTASEVLESLESMSGNITYLQSQVVGVLHNTDIVDNDDSNDSTKVLSARMGKVLAERIGATTSGLVSATYNESTGVLTLTYENDDTYEMKIGLSTTDKSNMADDVENVILADLFETFSTVKSYSTGDFVNYENNIYEFVSDKPSGAWDSTKVVVANLNDYIEEVNAKLDAQDNLIATMSQPKYYDVSSLPTTDVGLVVGSDGYIYSWDSANSEYVSTGIVYQATAVADKSIAGIKLSEELMNCLSFLQMPNYVKEGYLKSDGTYEIYGGYYSKNSYKLSCKEGEQFLYKGRGRSNAVAVIFYQDDTILSSVKYDSEDKYTLVTIPANCNYVIFSSYASSVSSIVFEVIKKTKLTQDLFENPLDVKEIGFALNREFKQGYLKSDGTYETYGGYVSYNISNVPCKEGDKFLFKGRSGTYAVSVIFYDSDNNILSTFKASLTDYSVVTIPAECTSVTFSSYAATENEIVFSLYILDDILYSFYQASLNIEYAKNILFEKKWYAYGDSFTHGDFTGISPASEYTLQSGKYAGQYAVYPFIIGNRTNCDVHNQAVNGLALKTFVQQSQYLNIPADADYITFYFGINDSHANFDIGEISDSTNQTFYGCWNILINWLLNNRPNTKIGIIISNGCDTTEYPIAEVNIAKKWGISYLDINGDDKLPMVIRANMRNLSNDIYDIYLHKYAVVYGTNNHPNVKAHYDESNMIQQWLERL